MGGVGDYFFTIGSNRHRKLDGLTIFLTEVIRPRGYIPLERPVQVLHHSNLHWLFFVIADSDFEALGGGAFVHLDSVIGTAALSSKVEGIPGVYADRFI